MTLKEKVNLRMQELGISPKRSLGQNFLVSEHVVSKIIEKLKSEGTYSQIIEVGPGLGALTDELEKIEKDLRLIEYDNKMVVYWKTERGHKVIHCDALEVDWIQQLETPSALVSNLPYQIGSRLFVDLSLIPKKPNLMILMFQKEVAESLYGPRTKGDISLLSLVRETFWNSNFLLEAGSIDFHPRPRVASQIVCFYPKKVPSEFVDSRYLKFLKDLLSQKKRKMITKLKAIVGREKAQSIFNELGISENARVHEIGLEKLKALYLKLYFRS